MAGMTAELAFTARELHREGIWSGRIADLLDVDELLVRRALNGEDFEDEPPAPVEDDDPTAPPPVDPNAWPPPIDGSTVWSTVRPVRPRTNVCGEGVRVREVLLWGKPVLINDRDEVFCDWCHHAFRTADQLRSPNNRCPVGLRRPPGVIYIPDASGDDDPEWTLRPQGVGFRDLMREPW
jgi:hypothetical protein